MSKKYTLKGINDEVDTCELCGKVELKRVMWICELDAEGNETENIMAVGSSCGSKLLTGKKNTKVGESLVKVSNAMTIAKKWFDRGFSLDQIREGLYHKVQVPCYWGGGEHKDKLIIVNDSGNFERAGQRYFVIDLA